MPLKLPGSGCTAQPRPSHSWPIQNYSSISSLTVQPGHWTLDDLMRISIVDQFALISNQSHLCLYGSLEGGSLEGHTTRSGLPRLAQVQIGSCQGVESSWCDCALCIWFRQWVSSAVWTVVKNGCMETAFSCTSCIQLTLSWWPCHSEISQCVHMSCDNKSWWALWCTV